MEITLASAREGCWTLVLNGDFDVRSTGEVRQAIRDALSGPEREVVVDLTGVPAIDATALRVLAYATREAGKSGHHLTLRGCGPAVRRMLHLCRLRHAVEVETESEAGVAPTAAMA